MTRLAKNLGAINSSSSAVNKPRKVKAPKTYDACFAEKQKQHVSTYINIAAVFKSINNY